MPIKLFVDCHAFDQTMRQGITTYIAGLYQAAVKIDAPVEYYFASSSPEIIKKIFGNEKNIHYLKYRTQNKYLRLSYEVSKLIRHYEIDYAHFQYIVPFQKKCKEIVTLHDILFLDFPEHFSLGYRLSKSLLFYLSAKRADILLTVSNYSKQRIAMSWRIPEQRINVTSNAVSEEWFHSVALPKSPQPNEAFSRYILYVSRFEPRKNHTMLLKIYRELKLWQKGIGLVFIGAQAERNPVLDKEIQKMPQEASSFFIIKHNVSFQELQQWYACATLFVFPSLAEGFGIPPLEASISGIPCLCSNQTAMSDFSFLGNGLFDPNRDVDLKTKISLFFEGSLDLPNIQAIRQTIMQKYSWKKSADVLLSSIFSKEHPLQ